MKNQESREKGLKTKAENRERFSAQTIRIDDDWRIVRADELNWQVEFKGKFEGYYGTLLHAFESLPSKMLGADAKGSLADIAERLKAIQFKIEDGLKGVKA